MEGLPEGGLELGIGEGYYFTCIAVSIDLVVLKPISVCCLCCRYFRDPKPDYRAVADDVSTFVGEIGRSLSLRVNRACCFSFVFRTDVFKFLPVC